MQLSEDAKATAHIIQAEYCSLPQVIEMTYFSSNTETPVRAPDAQLRHPAHLALSNIPPRGERMANQASIADTAQEHTIRPRP